MGGFVIDQLGRVPRKGESFQYEKFQVTILEATERAVRRVNFKLSAVAGKRRFGRKK